MPAPNFADRFNTELSPSEESKFTDWAMQQRSAAGRDVMGDQFDYDIRGWWKKHGNQDLVEGVHLEDEFKKPNHPTFSNESKYHGTDGYEGGEWIGDEKSGYSFKPGKTNMEMMSSQELKDYFAKVEPDTKLLLPQP